VSICSIFNVAEEIVILLQIYEWIALIYVIITQKGKKTEEILYDYQNENMHATMLHPRLMMKMFTRDTMPDLSRPSNIRKKEKLMSKAFFAYFIFKLLVGLFQIWLKLDGRITLDNLI
jgi:hypothetical protein